MGMPPYFAAVYGVRGAGQPAMRDSFLGLAWDTERARFLQPASQTAPSAPSINVSSCNDYSNVSIYRKYYSIIYI